MPLPAAHRERGDWCAYVAEEGRAHRRVVRLTSYGPLQSAVESGIREREAIIVQPGEALRDGARVRPVPAPDLGP